MMAARNEALGQTIAKERTRLLSFIKKRVASEADAEDILQDVFYQLADTLEPIEQISSWLFRVTRHKIIDWYRKKKPLQLSNVRQNSDNESEPLFLYDILSAAASDDPDAVLYRSLVWSELAEALDELPTAQREVFILHELEDKSFKEIADMTGVPVNTLLSRKRYAVLFLRERLRDIYTEFFND